MRSAIICVFSLIPLATMASYELAMFESYGKIQRYDPVNRVMLGSFGDGDIGTYAGFSMALSATRPGEVAVFNPDGAIRWLDYNTGISTSSVNLGWFHGSYSGKLSVQDDGNYVASVAGGETRIYSAGGTLLSTLSPFGSAYLSLSHTTDAAGNIYDLTRYDNGGGSYSFFSFVFNSAGTYQGYTHLGVSTDANYLRHATATSNRLIFGTGSSSLGPMVVTAPLSWGGSGTQVYGAGYVAGGWSHLAAGHNGRAHGIQSFYNGSTGYDTWYYSYDPVVGSWGYKHKLPGLDSHSNSFVMVVAPEPASALALAAGAFWLLRRKK